MSSMCNYCTNKTQCAECDKGWFDKFIPSEEVRHYFTRGYVGVRGINGSVYHFDTTNPALVSTHAVRIGSRYYCPYCGEEMFCIQDKDTLREIGHCCICDGARAEIAYENEKAKIEHEHKMALEKAMRSLRSKYEEKLTFCDKKLLEIKQENERKRLNRIGYKPNHFGFDEKDIITIDDMLF